MLMRSHVSIQHTHSMIERRLLQHAFPRWKFAPATCIPSNNDANETPYSSPINDLYISSVRSFWLGLSLISTVDCQTLTRRRKNRISKETRHRVLIWLLRLTTKTNDRWNLIWHKEETLRTIWPCFMRKILHMTFHPVKSTWYRAKHVNPDARATSRTNIRNPFIFVFALLTDLTH